jgi:hypothetical protein
MRPLSVVLALFMILPAAWSQTVQAIRIHPENPKYFLFRGKPIVLITASEHYGSVMNRPFDFEKYLDDAAKHKMTMTRTFLLFRELQGPRNPSSPCKPESPDYIAPFPRTGPGKAMDGEPVYDLDQWNPEYFERLHTFLESASRLGIIVELTLFSNTYADNIWELNPFRAENNKQQLERISWQDYLSLKNPKLLRRQKEYARKIVQETSQFDNVYYEISNEPGGDIPGHLSHAEIDAWQGEIAKVVREELNRLGRPHLISGQQAFSYSPHFRFPLDETFSQPLFDIVNVHPLPDIVFSGKTYQLGNFMSKELELANMARFSRDVYAEKKPVVEDEDNTASIYRDSVGWTIHRKRAWTSVLNGSHYDYIDFSITVGNEAGTSSSRQQIRSWMQHLSEFLSTFDYVHSSLNTTWIQDLPGHLVASGLAVKNKDYAIYLADDREVTDPNAGKNLGGPVRISLPSGKFEVSLYSPVSGLYSPTITIIGGNDVVFTLPAFENDIVIRARAI